MLSAAVALTSPIQRTGVVLRAAVSMQQLEPQRAQRGSPMPWKLGNEPSASTATDERGIVVFYAPEPLADESDTTCWLAPDGDPNGPYICSRDVDLWDHHDSKILEDSY